MGYIILRNGRVPGDPKWNFWGTVCLFIWIGVVLFIPESSESFFGKVFRIVWVGTPCVIIALFILWVIIVIIINQLSLFFPNTYNKLPKWLKKLSE